MMSKLLLGSGMPCFDVRICMGHSDYMCHCSKAVAERHDGFKQVQPIYPIARTFILVLKEHPTRDPHNDRNLRGEKLYSTVTLFQLRAQTQQRYCANCIFHITILSVIYNYLNKPNRLTAI
ncbi:hypothetical protein HYE67_008070 [Fusarium culmorum]|uniref:Uncharacterized protein n=1 Tax=Fusarium culmorum TaxID=5516 RepID=A0A2T4HBE6_FUSCU|nr:hypothetical protein FCULG_00002744 [Fusarium culmorum]QPC65839.1 hypothetical protein HYE67_008070 [Fusarium culmorum]